MIQQPKRLFVHELKINLHSPHNEGGEISADILTLVGIGSRRH